MPITKGTKINMILMFKDIPVANISFGVTGMFSSIKGFYNRTLMPPGTRVLDDFVEKRFKEWIDNRSIPTIRPNIMELNKLTGMSNPTQYYFQNRGASLNDCYWFQTEEQYNMDFGWDDINFFDNNYSLYSGEELLNLLPTFLNENFESPNFTTNGKMSKMWVKQGDKDILYKTGTLEACDQEVFNEILASEIASRLGINHVDYTLTKLMLKDGNERFFCKCENFCNKDWEFIPAQSMMVENDSIGKKGFIKYMEKNNLISHIYQMLVLDYIISNKDRNPSNFGVIRDTNTLEVVGMAPLFDNGTSLWCDWYENPIGQDDSSKPFELTHEKQIKMINDFSWLDLDVLDGINIYAHELYSKSNIPEEVQSEIINCMMLNIEKLKDIVISNNKSIGINIENDDNEDLNILKKPKISKADNGFG